MILSSAAAEQIVAVEHDGSKVQRPFVSGIDEYVRSREIGIG